MADRAGKKEAQGKRFYGPHRTYKSHWNLKGFSVKIRYYKRLFMVRFLRFNFVWACGCANDTESSPSPNTGTDFADDSRIRYTRYSKMDFKFDVFVAALTDLRFNRIYYSFAWHVFCASATFSTIPCSSTLVFVRYHINPSSHYEWRWAHLNQCQVMNIVRPICESEENRDFPSYNIQVMVIRFHNTHFNVRSFGVQPSNPLTEFWLYSEMPMHFSP